MGINDNMNQAIRENRELNQKLIAYFQTICLSLTSLLETIAEYDASFQRKYQEKFQAKVAQQGTQVGQVLLESLWEDLQKKGKPN